MSINISGYEFDGPFEDTSKLKDQSGVYVILTSDNTVVDVGESGEVKTRVQNHDRQACWNNNGGTRVAVLYVDGESARKKIADEVRDQYNPPCGDR